MHEVGPVQSHNDAVTINRAATPLIFATWTRIRVTIYQVSMSTVRTLYIITCSVSPRRPPSGRPLAGRLLCTHISSLHSHIGDHPADVRWLVAYFAPTFLHPILILATSQRTSAGWSPHLFLNHTHPIPLPHQSRSHVRWAYIKFRTLASNSTRT